MKQDHGLETGLDPKLIQVGAGCCPDPTDDLLCVLPLQSWCAATAACLSRTLQCGNRTRHRRYRGLCHP